MADGAELTPLDRLIRARIASSGPVSVYDFMDLALAHPEHGYYRRQTAIGRTGDFITAPEISQVFGELLGLWSAVVAHEVAPSGPMALIEIGPGRGTLMVDALRALNVVPALLHRLSVHLVEPNPALQSVQQLALAQAPVAVDWHTSLESIAAGPAIVLANEVIDALPIRQLIARHGAWHERLVGLTGEGGLGFLIAEQPLDRGPDRPLRDGDVLELRPDAHGLLARIAERARAAPTAALLIDYGHERSHFGDTLQAVRQHQRADALALAGEADLTAQVDFEALAQSARTLGLAVDGPVPQAAFLGSLGIVQRAERLMETAPPAQAASIEAAVLRLIDPAGMGSRFKVLGLRSAGQARLPGF